MTPIGLTVPEAKAIFALLSHLSSGHAIAWIRDPDDGLVAHILRESVGVVAVVIRIGGHLTVLDFNSCLGGVSGRYDAIGDVVNVLRLSLAETGPGPWH